MRLALAALLAAVSSSAQEPPAAGLVYDLAVGGNDDVRSFSAGAARRFAVLPGRRLLLGAGLRASLLTGRLELQPARSDDPERLVVDGARLAMLNASVHAAVRIAEPLEAGFNLDVAGVAAGGSSKSVSYRATPSAPAESVSAAPARGNLFLYGSNDIGSLNSEFYAAWRVSRAVTVRGGLSHFLAEYRADREGTTRFRRFMNLAFIAVRWTP